MIYTTYDIKEANRMKHFYGNDFYVEQWAQIYGLR